MKKCPTCDRTFDDAMKFCQTDGTPLIDAAFSAASDDVYSTTVNRQEDLDPFKTMVGGAFPKNESGDILQIPDSADPLKTMYATDEEMKREVPAFKPTDEGVIEVAPLAEDKSAASDQAKDSNLPLPAPPRFNEPHLSPPNFGGRQQSGTSADSSESNALNLPASSGESSPPKIPSPFEDKTEIIETKNPFDSKPFDSKPFGSPNSAIPSPFGEARPSSFDPPSTPLPTYKEPEPPQNDPFNQPIYTQPFEQSQPLQANEWTPPPAPEANWQNQSVGANTPFQPPVAGEGQNNTLSIVSLVLGILSIPCCGFVVFGIAAAVTGFLAKKKADENPALYGGRGMALAGMIIGIITAVLGLIITVLQVLFGVLGSLGNM